RARGRRAREGRCRTCFPCADPAPDGHRPQETPPPPRRPRLPADGRERRGVRGRDRLSEEAPVPMRIGETVGDLAFVRPDGAAVTLAAFAGRPLLLIFLRHLA